MESLFWIAFEQRRYEYIISVIHHAANLQWQATHDFRVRTAEPDAFACSADKICGEPEDCLVEHDLNGHRQTLQEDASSSAHKSLEVVSPWMSSDSQSHCDVRIPAATPSVTNKNNIVNIDADIFDNIENICYKTYTSICPQCSYERMF